MYLGKANLADDVEQLKHWNLSYSPVETKNTEALAIDWQMLRLDVLPEHINGNKGFKLLPHLLQAEQQGHRQIISFGGAHSNHLHALAFAAERYGFKLVAVVRAYPEQADTPTIKLLKSKGVTLHYATRSDYQQRYNKQYWQQLQALYGDAYIICEGGAGSEGEQGSLWLGELLQRQGVFQQYDYLALATGTGTCLKGLLAANKEIDKEKNNHCKLLGFQALANKNEIALKLQGFSSVELFEQYCFTGFAKTTPALAAFMLDFEQLQQIPLEPVYTAKLCYGIDDLMSQGYFRRGAKILTIHSGGLQGKAAMNDKIKRKASQHAQNDSGNFYDCA
jgi:1-aminocyclopropane-1-carboxylate deaminase/D-cysteine desulfhydrase-like pyridoxal-dependent ACC family enzyme